MIEQAIEIQEYMLEQNEGQRRNVEYPPSQKFVLILRKHRKVFAVN
jgi:hypothetical protein